MNDSDPSRSAGPESVRLLTRDDALLAALGSRLRAAGIAPEVFSELDALAAAGPSGVLLLDTGVLPPSQTLSEAVASLPAPGVLLCLVRSAEVGARLDALRAGARGCFVAPADPDVLAGRLVSYPGAAAEPYRVLVVDDQPLAAAFASRVLEGAGMRTLAVADPLAVLDAVEAFRPDLVLMDLHMPGASGLELTSLIRDHERHGHIPVVFLSAELNLGVQVEALRLGGDDFIAKPVSPGRLIDTVRERIALSRGRGAAPAGARGSRPAGALTTRDVLLRRVSRAIEEGADQSPGTGLLCVACKGADESELDRLQGRAAQLAARHAEPGDTLSQCDAVHLGLLAVRADAAALDALAVSLARDLAYAAIPAAVGIARFAPPVEDALALFSRARSACARQDARGWGRRFPDAPAGRGPVESALEAGRLELLYQPIVALRRRPGARYEVLVRLQQPDGEYLPADSQPALAADERLAAALDRRVMEHALDGLQRWHPQQPGLRLFIPQTLRGTSQGHWTAWLREQILARDLVRHRPVLQFDLAEVAADPALARRRFAELHRLGIRVCLDAVDASPEVLDLLDALPVALVRLVAEAPGREAEALDAVVKQFHEHEVEVIAAGVDSPRAIARVWSAGVDFMQGGFIQLPAAEPSFDFQEVELG
jgi:EAL domain-containing protein (putative c-di-GMP-specific phosphodiesterase class I)/DNA-binding response OmpR family regulator